MAKQQKPPQIDFLKTLDNIAGRHAIHQVFDDFMQMTICCFAMQTMETEYLAVAKRYTSDELQFFSKALADMVVEYEAAAQDGGWEDKLGYFFETINSTSQAQRSGQFFTPKQICDLMAQLTYGIEPCEEGTTVCDPACGSSRNLIAHSRLHPTNRWNCFYHGQDIDRRCVHMSVINMVMYGMKGVVIHMDALAMEVYSGFRIHLPELGSFVKKLSAAECKQYLFKPRQAEQPVIIQPLPTTHELVPVIDLAKSYTQATLF